MEAKGAEPKIEIPPQQRLQRVEKVLGQLIRADEFGDKQRKPQVLVSYDEEKIKFARGVLEAALGKDPNPKVVYDGGSARGISFDLSESVEALVSDQKGNKII